MWNFQNLSMPFSEKYKWLSLWYIVLYIPELETIIQWVYTSWRNMTCNLIVLWTLSSQAKIFWRILIIISIIFVALLFCVFASNAFLFSYSYIMVRFLIIASFWNAAIIGDGIY